jgi:hypothetical protein
MVYFSDDGDVLACASTTGRSSSWSSAAGHAQIWAEPFVPLRVPKLFNLRIDPFERADVTSNTYYDWMLENAYMVLAGSALVTPVPGHLRGVPATPEGRELHDRPGGGEAGDGARLGPMSLPSWNDGRHGRRSRTTSRGSTTSRPPSGSRSSTTTARCGARSRSTRSCCSCWRRPPSSPTSRPRSGREGAGLAAVGEVLMKVHAGITVEEFAAIATRWYAEARHPRFGVPFDALATSRCSSCSSCSAPTRSACSS